MANLRFDHMIANCAINFRNMKALAVYTTCEKIVRNEVVQF